MRTTTSAYWPTCQKQTLHAKEGISNLLHLFLSLITVGLWIPVWLIIGMKSAGTRTRCQTCGTKHSGLAHAARPSPLKS